MTLRAALRLIALVLLLSICVPSFAIARAFGGGGFWVRTFLRGASRTLGLRVTIVGRPSAGPVLFAANHISWLDILAIGGATSARFIAKSEIAGWPLAGWLATKSGSVFVERGRRSATATQANAVAEALGHRRPVVLFAEGGTGDGRTLEPFRPALFAAAVEAGAPVQPLAVDYGARAPEIAWPDGTSFATELKRMLARPGITPVTLRFTEPLDARALDRKRLAAAAYAAVAAGLA